VSRVILGVHDLKLKDVQGDGVQPGNDGEAFSTQSKSPLASEPKLFKGNELEGLAQGTIVGGYQIKLN
jgi:hypothetical protein